MGSREHPNFRISKFHEILQQMRDRIPAFGTRLMMPEARGPLEKVRKTQTSKLSISTNLKKSSA